MNDLDLLDDKILIWIYYKIPCFEKAIFRIFNLIFRFFILICFCINKLKVFEEWSYKNNYIPWSLFLVTCIILSWISYPKLLNQVIVQKDNLVEVRLQKEEGSSEENPIVNVSTLAENTNENFSYKKLGEGYGTLGDTYGALNTLFTGLAFGGLIVSIFLQMLELRATRKELAEQKDALIGQQKEFSAQTKILNRQIDIVKDQKKIAKNQKVIASNQLNESKKKNFIDQFNALMEEKRFKIQNLSIPHATLMDKSILGMNVFGEYAKQFRIIRNVDSENLNEKYFKIQWDGFVKHKYDEYDYSIFSYLRLCRFLFEFVEKNDIYSNEEKNIYFNIIKVSISTEEKAVWMWVGIFRPNIRKICNKYSILDGYHAKSMESIGVHFFKGNAFGASSTWQKIFMEEHGFSDNQE